MVLESLNAWSGVRRVDLDAKVLKVNKVIDFMRVG